jgi:transposase InsO family protein
MKHREERFLANGPNQAWSIDFVADQLQDGQRFRALTIVDVFTRETVQEFRMIERLDNLPRQHFLRKRSFSSSVSLWT